MKHYAHNMIFSVNEMQFYKAEVIITKL